MPFSDRRAILLHLRPHHQKLTMQDPTIPTEHEFRGNGAIDIIDMHKDEFMRIRACCGNHPGDASFEEIAGLCDRAIATIDQRVPVLEQRDKYQRERDAFKFDKERLDFLDKINADANAENGTAYGWCFDVNHNRSEVRLSDCHVPALTVREAIDKAMRQKGA